MTDTLKPTVAVARAPEEIVEYDDSRVVLSTNLLTTAPAIVTGSASISLEDSSDGSRYGASFSTYGVPGLTPFGSGPRAGAGGLSLGLFANKNGIYDDPKITPQIGVGGVSYTHGAGVCSGFWCAGANGLAPIHPAGMLIISGIEAIRGAYGVELESAGSVPAVIASKIVSNFIPVKQTIGAFSFFGIGMGMGPDAHRFAAIDEHFAFRNEIEELLELNARADAIRRLDAAIPEQTDPFVRADLMDLKDKVLFEKNQKDFPTGSIESCIRISVEAVDSFTAKYSEWLNSGRGLAPSVSEIESYMANAFYLARKLHFAAEKEVKGGKVKLNIRESSPFQIKDPFLAARFIEAVAGIYRVLGNKKSGLMSYVSSKTERTVKELLDESEQLKFGPDDPKPASRLLSAEARRAWHMQWIESMGRLYDNFHRRRDHMKWIVFKRAKGEERKKLIARISLVALPYHDDLRTNLIRMASCPRELAQRHLAIKPGIDALVSAANIEHEKFAGDMGDGSLLIYESKLRRQAWRPQIVDAFYLFGNLYKAISADKKNSGALARLAHAAAQRLINVMRKNVPEVRRERYAFAVNNQWKDFLLKRIDELSDAMGGIGSSIFERFANETAEGPDVRASLKSSIEKFGAMIAKTKIAVDSLAKEAKNFPANWGAARSFKGLHGIEMGELERISRFLTVWREFRLSYDELIREIKGSSIKSSEETDKTIAKWNEKIDSMTVLISKIVRNHARFNIKRIGLAYMESYLAKSQIDLNAGRDNDILF